MSGSLFCNDVVAADEPNLAGAALLHHPLLAAATASGTVPGVSALGASGIPLRRIGEDTP